MFPEKIKGSFSMRKMIFFPFSKTILRKVIAPYKMHGVRRCLIIASLSRAGLRHLHKLPYTQGETILKAKEKSNFTNVIEGDLLEDEVAFERFGYYSLL
jgi:hypothetical protein